MHTVPNSMFSVLINLCRECRNVLLNKKWSRCAGVFLSGDRTLHAALSYSLSHPTADPDGGPRASADTRSLIKVISFRATANDRRLCADFRVSRPIKS